MVKTQLVKRMEDYTNCPFITRSQLKTFLGYKSEQSVDKFLQVTRVGGKYFIEDVATEILRRME